MVASRSRRFTVDEYMRMGELGILAANERTELIDGEIIPMIAKGFAHTSATLRTQECWQLALGKQVSIRVQDPIALDNYSEPEPDIVIAKRDLLDYSTHHPAPDEVLLVIEIADSSLKYDLETKAPLYAAAGIQEYWVLDVVERQLYQFRQPQNGRYQAQSILAETLVASAMAFEELRVAISDMLPPLPNP
ncbi:MAG: Uma2 family endonuclease [Cyanobacteria bacterium P01_D01_bin.156]